MAHLLPLRFSALLCLSLLLDGCCANSVCDKYQDEQADAVKLNFTTGFSPAELDTLIIQRSPLPYQATNKAESVTVIRTAAQARDTLVLNNATPFAQTGTTKLNGYRYVVQYLAPQPNGKPMATNALVIDSVRLRGSLEGTGCCTYYTNTEKTAYTLRTKPNSTALENVVVDLKQKRSIEVTK